MMSCYDEQPIKFKPTSLKPTRGRFGRKKQYRVGEVTAGAMRRYLHVYMSSKKMNRYVLRIDWLHSDSMNMFEKDFSFKKKQTLEYHKTDLTKALLIL